VDERSPSEQEEILLDELGRYEPALLRRPRLVVGTKADVAQQDFDGMTISAVTRAGLDRFLGALGNLVDEARASEPEPEAFVVHRPAESGFSVVRDDDGAWRVTGRVAERVVAMADLTNPEAVMYVHDRFRRMGVERALERAGAQEGAVVRVANIELEYVP
ncbi:MAG TPA: Obg family GTPase CgtA, partial [Acidimicrobiia bacterium]|nr:Obg family GTPase CgtA [Acidimicrobiia bacterium]